MRLNDLLPPADLIAYASGSYDANLFRKTSADFLNYFRDYANLQPGARVLDLGCGCGRMALALASYLDRSGSYDGLDLHRPSIEWASEAITGRCPNFRFQHADVRNSTYNPGGRIPQHQYRLPFVSRSFDFVYLTSVFTHMLPNAAENYVREIARVLKVGGKCLLTFFLLNDDCAVRVQTYRAAYQFPQRYGICAVQNAEKPEDVVGYNETAVVEMLRLNGFELPKPILYGTWSGYRDGTSFQDLVIAQKVRHVSWSTRLYRHMFPLSADAPEFQPEPRFAPMKAAA